MNRNEFAHLIQKNMLHGVYLLEGVEEVMKADALHQVRAKVLPAGLQDLNETVLEHPQTSQIIAAAETLPMMADQRLVVIQGHPAFQRGDADDKLLEYLPHVPQSAIVLFYTQGKADSRKKLYKAIEKLNGVVSFAKLTEQELNAWILSVFKASNKTCSFATASLLTFIAGSDSTRLQAEIDKVIDYLGDLPEVTEDAIRAVVTRSPEYTVFMLVDAVVDGKDTKAFTLLQEMLTSGEERIAILAMLLRQYRILQHVKIMLYEKQTNQQIQELLGLRGFMLDRSLKQARSLSGGQVKQAVELCLDTEYRIKSGQLNQEGAVEACIIKLLQLRHPAQP